MDGYTVDEAASVLGVPQARVWELLARGVLAGAPEGESGMRVFLKGGVGEEVTNRPERAEPGRGSNGNGGHHGSESGEMTPFRELLTEFRNLTERYGQALLALGEARGEVASLRSRVELLEARIDLRLPSSRPASTVAWEMPDYAASPPPTRTDDEAAREPVPEAEIEAAIAPAAERAAEPEPIGPLEGFADELPTHELPADELPAEGADVEGFLAPEEIPVADLAAEPPAPEAAPAVPPERATSRRKRLHPGREAMSGLAEALARAQDPTLADLPGVREAAEALAELRREIDAGAAAEQVAGELPEASADVVEGSEGIAQVQPEAVAVEEPEPIAATAIPLEEIAQDEEAVSEVQVAFEEQAAPTAEVVAAEVTFEDEEAAAEEPRGAPALEEEAADVEGLLGEAPAFEEEILQVAELAMPEEQAAVREEPPSEAPPLEEEAAVVEEISGGAPAFEEEVAAVAAVAMPEEAAVAEEVPGEAVTIEEEAAVAEEPPPSEAGPVEEEIAQVAEVAIPLEEAAVAGEFASADEPVAAEPSEQPSHYSTDVVEPDWFADGDFTWLEAAEAERIGAAVDAGAAPEVHDEAPADVLTAEAAVSGPPAPFEAAETLEASVGTGPGVEPIETASAEAELPESELPLAELPTPEAGEATAEGDGEAVAASRAEPVIEGTPAAVASPAPEEEAPAELIDEAWNEPAGEPVWTEPAASSMAPNAALESEEQAAASVEPAGTDISQEWPLEPEPEPSQATTAMAAPTEPAEESRLSPPAGDALGGFRAASAEELGQSPPGPARAGEEELMWLGDEFEAAGLEIASQGWRGEGHPAEAEVTKPPVFELSDAELARLARDEGWNLDEVNAIRAFLGRPDEGKRAASEPIAGEPSTAEAVESSEGGQHEPAPHEPASDVPQAVAEGEPPPADSAELAPHVDAPGETMGAEELSRRLAAQRTPPPATSQPGTPEEPRSQPGEPDPEWLHGRRGPAATAYRRLRRLFPG